MCIVFLNVGVITLILPFAKCLDPITINLLLPNYIILIMFLKLFSGFKSENGKLYINIYLLLYYSVRIVQSNLDINIYELFNTSLHCLHVLSIYSRDSSKVPIIQYRKDVIFIIYSYYDLWKKKTQWNLYKFKSIYNLILKCTYLYKSRISIHIYIIITHYHYLPIIKNIKKLNY